MRAVRLAGCLEVTEKVCRWMRSTRFIISNRGTVFTAAAGSSATSVVLPDLSGTTRDSLHAAFVGASLVISAGAGIGQHATIQVRGREWGREGV